VLNARRFEKRQRRDGHERDEERQEEEGREL